MSLRSEQLGRAHTNRHGHTKPSQYRKFVKNQTNRKRRRQAVEQKPTTNRYNGYD